MSATGTRAHGSLSKPSMGTVLAAARSMTPRVVTHGKQTARLPGVTLTDLCRHLDAAEDTVRAALSDLVAARHLRVERWGNYICYCSTQEPQHG